MTDYKNGSKRVEKTALLLFIIDRVTGMLRIKITRLKAGKNDDEK